MNNQDFSTKLESNFIEKTELLKMLPKIKTIYNGNVETMSVWKALDKETNEVQCQGFVLFRKVTPKDKLLGRKLLAVMKFKTKLTNDGSKSYWLDDSELKEDAAKKYCSILE